MALYSNLRDYRFNDTELDDIRGAEVYGVDEEKLGKIEDVIFDSASGELRYVVLDSGGWLSSKKFVVPARQLMIRDEQDKDFHVSLTKKQIERFPEYQERSFESDAEFTDYERRYKEAWSDGPVMHREGSTHAITPEPVAGSAGGDGLHHASPRRIAHDMPRFGATSSSDTAETGSLIGETDQEPILAGQRKTVGRQIDEPVTGMSQDSLFSSDHNPRVRTFENWLRKYREDILRKRREDNAA
jgi:sporulation protein YlmC with PRC-barrel domain